jgi:hypothetical protein
MLKTTHILGFSCAAKMMENFNNILHRALFYDSAGELQFSLMENFNNILHRAPFYDSAGELQFSYVMH